MYSFYGKEDANKLRLQRLVVLLLMPLPLHATDTIQLISHGVMFLFIFWFSIRAHVFVCVYILCLAYEKSTAASDINAHRVGI